MDPTVLYVLGCTIWATVDIVEKKKLFKSWIQLRRRSKGPFSRSSIISVTWRQRVLFFQTPSTHVLSYNSLFHIIPIIHTVPLARARSFVVVSPTAQRALISGSLVGYPQKTFRKKFLRHFVEPPGQRTRMLSKLFFFVYPFLSLCLRLSRSHPVIAGEQVSFIRGGMRRD